MKINLQLFAATKTDEEIAREVIAGKWGNGTTRKNNLTQAGYNASNVQSVVNAMLNGSYKPTNPTTPATTAPATTAPTSFKYEEFKYDPYTESDTVKQANAMLQEHIANKPGEYTSPWQAQLDDTLNKILNREEFSYDLNGDALYQQYKDQFATQGKQASMDVMGQAATMTGGYGNSYAQTVGQQTYQGYLQQLNDKVPELYQIALNQYNQEGQDLKDQAILLGQQDEKDYGRYRDSVSDFYTNLDYLTGRADTLAKNEYDDYWNKLGMDYQIHTDNQTAGAAAKSDATELALSMLGAGIMPSADVLATAGISSADAQAIASEAKTQKKGSSVVSSNPTGIVGDLGDDPVGDDTPTPIPDNILQKAATFEDNESLAEWAYALEDNGTIGKGQAAQLISQFFDHNEKTSSIVDDKGITHTRSSYSDMVKSTNGWSVVNDGGTNWGWGVDNNAIVKAPNGQQIRLDNLVGYLVDEGMTKSDAKSYVKKLQKNLGI